MAFVVISPGEEELLIVVGQKSRTGDDRQARDEAKLDLQEELRQALMVERRQRNIRYSFSHLPDQTWAAATDHCRPFGIDAARDDEFATSFPLVRVFHAAELAAGSPGRIWSAKEAVLKALGCGFDGFSPLAVRILDLPCGDAAKNPAVGAAILSTAAVDGMPGLSAAVWSRLQPGGIWISLAWIQN